MAEITRDTTSNTIGTGTGGLTLDPNGTETVTINNGVYLPDGTEADPALTFTDDTNCGLFSPTNDSIALSAHGVEQVRMTGVASAVNQVELKGSATGTDVEINAIGDDADISIDLSPKGSGTVSVNGTDVSLSTHNHAGVYEPADATILKDADIGVNVQAYDATILVDADIGVNIAAYSHTHEGTTIDATGITDGYVLTADGAGNAGWEAPTGGGGGGTVGFEQNFLLMGA